MSVFFLFFILLSTSYPTNVTATSSSSRQRHKASYSDLIVTTFFYSLYPLISFKFAKSQNCFVTFTSGLVSLQYLCTGKVIGTGNETRGLYQPMCTLIHPNGKPSLDTEWSGLVQLAKSPEDITRICQVFFRILGISHANQRSICKSSFQVK